MNATKARQPTVRAVRDRLAAFGIPCRVSPASQARVWVKCPTVEATATAAEVARLNGFTVRPLGPNAFYVLA